MARQVGPRRPLACAERPARARTRCRRAARSTGIAAKPLQLTRSYEVPSDDPAYDRVLNWSWTYDSAVAAAAFVASGEQGQAARVLDQLAALQRSDGTLETAFDVSTGESTGSIRAGTMAWIGLAMVTYDRSFNDRRYVQHERLAADALLALTESDGLVRGGPDVKWVSTQHNLVAYTFLADLADRLEVLGDAPAASEYRTAAARMTDAIESRLLVKAGDESHFRQGVDDAIVALDVQALGAMYLLGRGLAPLADQVYTNADDRFAIDGRSIEKSRSTATFNMRYAAKGPFAGYRPYLGDGTPEVLWFEGLAEMRLAGAALSRDTRTIDKDIERWWSVTRAAGSAPLGADRTVTIPGLNEYHVWPTAGAGAWSILSQAAPAFFLAPPALSDSLVTDWTKVRETSPITTYPDGRVDMTSLKSNGGERRILAGTGKRPDVTVSADATLTDGPGWGVIVRATTDSRTYLTSGYVVQLDKAFGQLVLRQWNLNVNASEYELTTPLARAALPSGFDWNARTRLTVAVTGNTLTARVNDAPTMNVTDLEGAGRAAAKTSPNFTGTFTAPATGRYGIRAWGTAKLMVHQTTVTAR